MQHHICLSNSLHRLKVILIHTVLFMLFFLVACSKSPVYDGEQTFRFTGTVTDKNSGSPIAGATVQLFNAGINNRVLKSTKTDQEGRYYMEYQGQAGYLGSSGLSQPHQLEAIAEGYYARVEQIGSTESPQTINFQLPPIN